MALTSGGPTVSGYLRIHNEIEKFSAGCGELCSALGRSQFIAAVHRDSHRPRQPKAAGAGLGL